MKKKILITSVHMDIGGIETVLLNFLKLIDPDKFEVDLVLYKPFGINLKKIPAFIKVYSPFSYKGDKFIENWTKNDKITSKIIRKLNFNNITLKHYISSKKYDVGIAFSGYHYLMDKFVGLSKCKKKYIWVHTDFKYLVDSNLKFKKRFYKESKKYNDFDKIICVSKSCEEQFKLLLSNQQNKITSIENLFYFDKSIQKQNLNGKFKILSIGRLSYQKGYDRLISVVEKLKQDTNEDFFVTVLGDGEEKQNLLDLAKNKKIEDKIEFKGFCNDVSEYLNSADLLVSTSYAEGAGMVFLEALASKVPIVAPKVTGVKDIEEFAPKDSVLLTDNHVEGIKNGIIQAMKGKVNKNFNFDIDKYNNRIIKLYRRVLEGDL